MKKFREKSIKTVKKQKYTNMNNYQPRKKQNSEKRPK